MPLTRDLQQFIKCLNVRLTHHTLFRSLPDIRLKYLLKFVDIVDRRQSPQNASQNMLFIDT